MKLRGLIRPEDRSTENAQTETPSTLRVTYTDTHVIFEKDQIHDWEVKLYNPEYFRLIGFPDAEISIMKAAEKDELVGGGGEESAVGEIHGPFQYFSYFMRPLKSNEPRASEMTSTDEPKTNLPYYENFSGFMNSVFDRLTGKTPILEKDKEPGKEQVEPEKMVPAPEEPVEKEEPIEPEKMVPEPVEQVEKEEPIEPEKMVPEPVEQVEKEEPVEPEKMVSAPEEPIEPEKMVPEPEEPVEKEEPVEPVEQVEKEEPIEPEKMVPEPEEKEATDNMISDPEPVEDTINRANPVGQESGVRSTGKRMVWRVKLKREREELGEKEKEEEKKRSEMKEEKAIKRVKGKMKGEWYEVGERMLRIGEVEELSVEYIYEYEESKYKLSGTLMEQLSGKRVKIRL